MRAAPITRRARLLTFVAFSVVAVSVALPASGAGSGSSLRVQAGQLRQENTAIASRSRAAVLTLYALDSQLTRAEAQLASLRSEAAAVERRRAETRGELAVAKQVFAASQRNLANRLRAAYEQGDSDTLAIVLGAKTLDDALSALETAKAAEATDRAVVAQARKSRDRYRALQRELAARAEKLHRLEATVSASARTLAAAKSERIGYLRQLAAQRSLNTRQIGSLESRAQAIEAQARRVAVEQTVTTSSPAPGPAPPGPVASGPPAAAGGTLTVTATAYTLQGYTATGAPVGYGVVAVDPSVIPLGTRMTIPGYGDGVAADTGGAIQGAAIDLWFPTAADAAAWGRRTVTITLH
ncbi:MAG TPA: 3D domain-containing protein [Gaiellaceae bacterium]|nr:3D domain-containing protein [Gaiellaceae bacterium]